jgi:hypothetical protein
VGVLDVVWHLLNFLAPAVGLGVLSAALAKLVWRRDLRTVTWLRLALWSSAAATLALVGGLLVLGRDGKIAAYAVMVLASALTLWWTGFGRPSR